MKKKVLSLALVLCMVLALTIPAFAANPVQIRDPFTEEDPAVIAELSDVVAQETNGESGYKEYHLSANATVTFHIPEGSAWWGLFRCNGMWIGDDGLKNDVAYTNEALKAATEFEWSTWPDNEYFCEIMMLDGMTDGAHLFKIIFDGKAAEPPAPSAKPETPVETTAPSAEYEASQLWTVTELGTYKNVWGGDESGVLKVRLEDGTTAYLDRDGKAIDMSRYDWTGQFYQGYAQVNKDGKYGFIDGNGKEVVSCRYDAAYNFSEGLAAVRPGDHMTGKWGFVDTTGKEVIPCRYSQVQDFSGGYAIVMDQEGRWACIDKTGKSVFTLERGKYDNIYGAAGGAFQVTKDGKYGLVNLRGQEVVPCKYDSIDYLHGNDGYVIVRLGDWETGKRGVLTIQGQEVIPCEYASIGATQFPGLVTAEREAGNYIYISFAGTEYSEAFNAGEGFSQVCKSDGSRFGKWGFVDATGKEVVSCQYDGVGTFSDGLANVTKTQGNLSYGALTGYVDTTGKEVIPVQNLYSKNFSEGLAPVQGEDLTYGFMDKTGSVVIPVQYYDAKDFGEGLAAVSFGTYPNEKWGFINRKGKELVPAKYDDVRSFREDLAAVCVDKKWGFVDATGREVVPCQYDWVQDFDKGLAWVNLEGKTGVLDKEGRVVLPCKYRGVRTLGGGYMVGMEEGQERLFRVTPANESPAICTAIPTNDTLRVNGQVQKATVYKIDGANYFRIRDVAMLLSGSSHQVEVGYDGATNSVTLTTEMPYTPNGSELAGAATGSGAEAMVSNDVIYIDGVKATLTVYKINGANYFKLRDLGVALDFNVGWNAEQGMYIEPNKPYDPAD